MSDLHIFLLTRFCKYILLVFTNVVFKGAEAVSFLGVLSSVCRLLLYFWANKLID